MKKIILMGIIIAMSLSLKAQTIDTNIFEIKKSTVSNVEYYISNYGIWGNNVQKQKGGVFWPRGTEHQYIYGSGLIFATKKANTKLSILSYDPNRGTSSFFPGVAKDSIYNWITDKNYRTFQSTQYEKINGVNTLDASMPVWPLWQTDTDNSMEYGTKKYTYVSDVSKRNLSNYPNGPLFVSDEDFVSFYNDLNLSRYSIASQELQNAGYPIGLQVEERVMSWNSEEMKDAVVIFYTIENISLDTLKDCWIGSIVDFDISSHSKYSREQAGNDRIRYIYEKPELNLVTAWTDTTRLEGKQGMGYVGFSLIETPAVSANGYIRTDKSIFEPSEQLRTKTLKSFNIDLDPKYNEYYDMISANNIQVDTLSGDKRILLGTGSFIMKPGDKARFAIAVNFAMPYKGGEADGTLEDIMGPGSVPIVKGSSINYSKKSLVQGVEEVRKQYYKALKSKVNEENLAKVNFSLYPNPTSNKATIEFDNSAAGVLEIRLLDNSGKELGLLLSDYVEKGRVSKQLNLNELAPASGNYFISVQINNANTLYKQINIIR